MEITKTDNIAFKTNIKCVSPDYFRHKVWQMIKSSKNYKLINNFDINPTLKYNGCRGYRTNITEGYTENIRTCTAGIVANKGEKAPLFMHILNSEKNYKDINLLEEFFHGTNAIIIGSKDTFSYSRAVFDKLKHIAAKKQLPLTIMRGLPLTWQASLAYQSEQDTLYLCVNDNAQKSKYVKNEKMLRQIFKKIEISPTDNIEFLSKFQEFLLMIGFPFQNFKRAINLFHQ